MPKSEELLRLINEASSRTARIKTFAAKINTAHESAPDGDDYDTGDDDYGTELLSANLEIAIDHLRIAQEMASYLSRPIKETSRLRKNGSGQYETAAGFCFREGSPIEVLVPDKYRLEGSHWERTYLRYDGRDYYLADHTGLPLRGLTVRIREGDQP